MNRHRRGRGDSKKKGKNRGRILKGGEGKRPLLMKERIGVKRGRGGTLRFKTFRWGTPWKKGGRPIGGSKQQKKKKKKTKPKGRSRYRGVQTLNRYRNTTMTGRKEKRWKKIALPGRTKMEDL